MPTTIQSVSWRSALLLDGATIEDAITRLNEAAIQIVIVVNSDEIFIGTITDGDIRRALLRGLSVKDKIDSVFSRSALVVPPDIGSESVIQLMRANRIHHLPIVDEYRKVIGLYLWDGLSTAEERKNTLVVMAGGLGTRMHPHTENCPKPLLPVAGKPILEHIIERARADGFVHFVLSVRYLAKMIEDYFGDGSKWGVKIEYLHEEEPLGTAGPLSLFESNGLPFIVTNGDVLTDIKYGELLEFHSRNQAQATMAVRMYEWQHPFGVVRTEGINIVGFEEKPVYRSHVNAGVYAFSPLVLSLIPKNLRCDMPTLFELLRDQAGQAIVYPMHEPWLDVGRPADYVEAGKALALQTLKNGRK